jgi:hypothetical protein
MLCDDLFQVLAFRAKFTLTVRKKFSEDIWMLELNEDQKRNFLTTLEHVDKLLSDSEHVLNNARLPSFLPEYVCDISPEQRERILEYIVRFRVAVSGLLKQHGLMPPQGHKSSLGAIRTYLLFADMALEEIDSKNMDHGKLSDETAKELDMVVSQMHRFIHDMRMYLDREAKSQTG